MALIAIGSLLLTSPASADPVIDFFKSISRSMGRANQKPQPRPRPRDRKTKTVAAVSTQAAAKTVTPGTETRPAEVTVSATPVPTPQIVVRAASISPETHNATRDIPYGIPVPNKPGFVTSPYAPNEGLVDVRAFRSGTAVKDPYTGKSFLTP